MKSNERRLRTIYLSLTPEQIVIVWLRNALQAGTLEALSFDFSADEVWSRGRRLSPHAPASL